MLQDTDVDSGGWSSGDISQTDDGPVHGVWGNSPNNVEKTFVLTAHTKLNVKARFWALDSWDGEFGYMDIDGEEWWSKEQGCCTCDNGFESFAGSVPNPWGGDDAGHKCYFDIDVKKPHTASSAIVTFRTNIGQGATDESWAFSNVRLYTDGAKPELLLQVTDVDSGGWSTGDITQTDDGALHGIWGSTPNSVQKTFDLTTHTKMRIQARFWALDSWDGEYGYLDVDEVEWWNKQQGCCTCDNGFESFAGSVPNPWGGDDAGHKCYFDIDET